MTTLTIIRDKVLACSACGLRSTCRAPVPGYAEATTAFARHRQIVPDATRLGIVLIGEAPGQREDEQGQPFVGASGQVLTSWLVKAGNPDVYITNTVKCRPPKNRPPTVGEKAACRPHLEAELAAVKPKVIVCFGKHAAMSQLWHLPRGTTMAYLVEKSLSGGTGVLGKSALVSYHPSYYLQAGRQEAIAEKCIAVLKRAIELAGEPHERGAFPYTENTRDLP